MGLPQKCTKLYKYGHEAYKKSDEKMTALSGTYSTHMILPEGSTVVPIAKENNSLPAPLALCCIMNCGLLRRANCVSDIIVVLSMKKTSFFNF